MVEYVAASPQWAPSRNLLKPCCNETLQCHHHIVTMQLGKLRSSVHSWCQITGRRRRLGKLVGVMCFNISHSHLADVTSMKSAVITFTTKFTPVINNKQVNIIINAINDSIVYVTIKSWLTPIKMTVKVRSSTFVMTEKLKIPKNTYTYELIQLRQTIRPVQPSIALLVKVV